MDINFLVTADAPSQWDSDISQVAALCDTSATHFCDGKAGSRAHFGICTWDLSSRWSHWEGLQGHLQEQSSKGSIDAIGLSFSGPTGSCVFLIVSSCYALLLSILRCPLHRIRIYQSTGIVVCAGSRAARPLCAVCVYLVSSWLHRLLP